MRRALAPLLFNDDDPGGGGTGRATPVEKAQPSGSAKRKAASRTTPEGLAVQGMTGLLNRLGSLTLNPVTLPAQPNPRFMMTAEPTAIQAKACELPGLLPQPRV